MGDRERRRSEEGEEEEEEEEGESLEKEDRRRVAREEMCAYVMYIYSRWVAEAGEVGFFGSSGVARGGGWGREREGGVHEEGRT